MLYTITQDQLDKIRNYLATVRDRAFRLSSKFPDESLCTRLAVDSESAFNDFELMACSASGPPDADGLVDVIAELQGRLPRGTSINIMIPPLRHDRG